MAQGFSYDYEIRDKASKALSEVEEGLKEAERAMLAVQRSSRRFNVENQRLVNGFDETGDEARELGVKYDRVKTGVDALAKGHFKLWQSVEGMGRGSAEAVPKVDAVGKASVKAARAAKSLEAESYLAARAVDKVGDESAEATVGMAAISKGMKSGTVAAESMRIAMRNAEKQLNQNTVATGVAQQAMVKFDHQTLRGALSAQRAAQSFDKMGDEARETAMEVAMLGQVSSATNAGMGRFHNQIMGGTQHWDKYGIATEEVTWVANRAQARTASFGEVLDRASDGTLSMARGMGKLKIALGLGALAAVAAAAGVSYLAVKQVQYVKEMEKGAAQTKMSVQEYQRLNYVFEKQGAKLGELGGAWQKLDETKKEALEGSVQARLAFSELGVSLDELKEMSSEDVFKEISEGVKNAADQTEALEDVTKVFGKEFSKQLMPVLRKGSGEIDRLAREAEEAGKVLGDDAIKDSKRLGQEIDLFMKNMKAMGAGLVEAWTPVFTFVLQGVNDLMGLFGGFDEVPAKMAKVEGGVEDVGDAAVTAEERVQGLTMALRDVSLEGVDQAAKWLEQGEKVEAGIRLQLAVIDKWDMKNKGYFGIQTEEQRVRDARLQEMRKSLENELAINKARTIDSIRNANIEANARMAAEADVLALKEKLRKTSDEQERERIQKRIEMLQLVGEMAVKAVKLEQQRKAVEDDNEMEPHVRERYLVELKKREDLLLKVWRRRKKLIELGEREDSGGKKKKDDEFDQTAFNKRQAKDREWLRKQTEAAYVELMRQRVVDLRIEKLKEADRIRQAELGKEIAIARADQQQLEGQDRKLALLQAEKNYQQELAAIEEERRKEDERAREEAKRERRLAFQESMRQQQMAADALTGSFEFGSRMRAHAVEEEAAALEKKRDALGEDQEERRKALDKEIAQLKDYTDVAAALGGLTSNIGSISKELQTMHEQGASTAAVLESSFSAGGAAVGTVLEELGVGYRKVAGIRALFETAASWAAFADGNIPGGIAHATAASIFGGMAILGAGGGGSGSGGAGAAGAGEASEPFDIMRVYEMQKRAHLEALREARNESRGVTHYYDYRGSYNLNDQPAGRREARRALEGDDQLTLGAA